MADSMVVAAFVVGKILKYTFKALAAMFRFVKNAVTTVYQTSHEAG